MIFQDLTPEFSFIHAADIHLDSPLRGLEAHDGAPVAEIRGATRRALDGLVALAEAEKAAFVLIAGDLFDGDWKDYNTGLFFAQRMGRLAKTGIRVFIVAGNHDAASQMSRAMPWPDNVTVFSPRKPESLVLEEYGVVIHGQSYPSRAVADNLARGYPPPRPGYLNIGLLHTSLTGRPGHAEYAPCSLADLQAKGYEYWALGHVHRREIVAEEPWIVFPGNIQGRNIREEGAKGVTLVTVSDGRVNRVRQAPLDLLRWATCTVDLSGCDTMDSVFALVGQAFALERQRAEGRILALRLVLSGISPVHTELLARTERWTEEFRGLAAGLGELWLEKVSFHTARPAEPNWAGESDNPLAGLVKAIEEIELDGDRLLTLVPELATLQSKLPPEISAGEEPFLAPSTARTAELRTEVRELLIARLLRHGRE
jgi:DNA repair protein SbcD/Mre11